MNIIQNFFCYVVFIPMMLISSIMVFLTDSWLGQWMSMEVNMISFLGLILFEKINNKTYAMIYFFIQSFNSYFFLNLSMNFSEMNEFMIPIGIFVMNLCMLTKMGLPPFYIWYIKMIKYLNWLNCFFLMTLQKLIPLFVLNNLSLLNNLFVMKFNMINMIFISLICVMMGLQSMNLKILMAYSSIIQMAWMIMMLYLSEKMMFSMLMIYFMISISLILNLNLFNSIYVNDLSLLIFNAKWMFIHYMYSLFSLSGIPPYFGFMLKWISIQEFSMYYSFYMMLLMIINSLISMYFYIRLMFMSLAGGNSSIKMNNLLINYMMKYDFKLIYLIWLLMSMLIVYQLI